VKDLREWIALLEREGELVRVSAEVDPDLEITEIVDRTVKSGGPALLFEHPKGSEHPLLINQFGTERRMCLAFGVERLDDVARRVADVLEMQPPSGLLEKVRGLQKLKSVADSRPKTVGKGACQEIVLRGDEVDLGLLPIQRCWPGDPAPFITLPAVLTHDPKGGGRTGRSTRTAAPTTSRPTVGSRSPSRSGSTRSPRTRRVRRCRSTSTNS
jgi:4-hydroxy-3-polyprenylbenzoate decarboxylase